MAPEVFELKIGDEVRKKSLSLFDKREVKDE